MPVPDREDLSSDYLEHIKAMELSVGMAEFDAWLAQQPTLPEQIEPPKAPEVEFPKLPKAEPTTTGTIARSISEIPKQAVGGAADAVTHALNTLQPVSDWLDDNVADLGTIDIQPAEPKTPTGRITRSLAEFLTGFIPALKGLKTVGLAGKVTAPMAAGVLSDFLVRDPHEARLANLWQELDLPQNVLTDYLAADPEDSAIEGRFKSALEGAGLGAAMEGVYLSARFLRAARKVKDKSESERDYLKGKYGEITDERISQAIGPSKGPAIEYRAAKKLEKGFKETKDVKPEELGLRGIIEEPDAKIFINWNRITSPDDVKAVMSDMAERYSKQIDKARRGKITTLETEKMADDLGMSVTDLLARTKGQAFNAEQIIAARKLWGASAESLTKAAVKAAGADASPLDQFIFRKMLATHYAIQAEVLGARAEAGRALRAWAIPTGGGIERARMIEQTLEAMGGEKTAKEMASRLAKMTKFGAHPSAIKNFAERGRFAASVDAIREVWVSGLLTSPQTHFVNSNSNMSVLMQQILERKVAESYGAEIVPGEAVAMAYGAISSMKDALRLAYRSLKTGEMGHWAQKVDLPRQKAMSSESLQIASETGLGRAVDFIGMAAQVPFRLLGSADEFYKTIGFRAELHARALRDATQKGLQGQDFHQHIHNVLRNPPEDMRIAATDAALYNTFTDRPGDLASAILKVRNTGSPIRQLSTAIILPFVRTPSRIINYSLERSPAAPLLSRWREDVAAGGARGHLAMTRMAMGTATMAVAFDFADSGVLTGYGPRDPAERAFWLKTHQPYSVKVGNRWVSYNRLDPLGMQLGLAADIAHIVHRKELGTRDLDELKDLAASAITAVSQVTINKTYLQGLANTVEVLSDPQRYGPRYLYTIGGSFVPATALVGTIERAVDPTLREVYSLRDAIESRIVGLSDRLPPKRELWGDPITIDSELGKGYDLLSPYRAKVPRSYPIDLELERLAVSQLRGDASLPRRIAKESSFQGVQVSFADFPDVYDEYVRLSGNELKSPAWGKGAREFLDDVVQNKHPMGVVYQMLPDELKLRFISNTIQQYRKLAQFQIMNDPKFGEFQDHIRFRQEITRERRMPVLQ